MGKVINALIIQDKRLLLFKKNLVWILPGGKPLEGESYVETLVREFKDKASGAEIIPGVYYGCFIEKTPYVGENLEAYVYFADLKKPNLDIIPSGEISGMLFAGFFSIPNLKQLSNITYKIVSCLKKEGYI